MCHGVSVCELTLMCHGISLCQLTCHGELFCCRLYRAAISEGI